MKIRTEINLDRATWRKTGLTDVRNINKFTVGIVTTVLRHLNFRCKEFVVSMFFTNDKKIQKLNKEHRGKDCPTNVLSFTYTDEDVMHDFAKYYNSELYIGELIFAYQTILREAQTIAERHSDAGLPLENFFHTHLSHLIVHGTLHLLGYDHEDDAEAEAMEDLENRILTKLEFNTEHLL